MTRPTNRAAAREETQREIMRVGREQLAEVGAAALSLRAVARELGMVSSAIYRYVESRDELLTRLIDDAYNSLGDTVEADVRSTVEFDPSARWVSAATAARRWAVPEFQSSFPCAYWHRARQRQLPPIRSLRRRAPAFLRSSWS